MDILGVIAAGMRQLQDAQSKAFERKGSTGDPEAVKPGTSTLPELKPPLPESSPVEVQDWLQLLAAPMSDLSDSSGEWWCQVQQLAQDAYRVWSDATPLERLTLRAPRSKDLEEGRYARLNARAASMILAALDPSVRGDLVSRKSTQSTSQILYRILTLYQPGGENEKRLVIDQLTNPTSQDQAGKAAESLRTWERWYRRAADVGVTIPDPTILARALMAIMKKVLDSNQEAAFRTSLLRNSLKLDTKPTEETILALHKHLLAEAEGLSTSSARSTAATSTSAEANRGGQADRTAKVKGMQATGDVEPGAKAKASPPAASTSTSTSAKPCKWFAKSDSGCRRGAECQFLHEWGSTPKAGRCLLCSATGHMKKDCPSKDKSNSSAGGRQRARDQPQASSSSTATSTNKALAAASEPTSPTSQPASEPSPKASSSAAPQTAPEAPQQEDLKQMIADASKMIKTMMTNNAQPSSSSTSTSSGPPTYESIQRQLDELRLKMMKVEGEADGDERGVLLDSGSTHILRPPSSTEELKESKPVAVTLATDEQRVLHQSTGGSIIVKTGEDGKDAQTILPFGKVIEVLGCTLKWTKAGLHLHHPRHGRIKTRMRAGCPEITDAGQAAMIISELEMKKVEELKEKTEKLQNQLLALRMMEIRNADWRLLMAKYVEGGVAVDGLQALYKAPMFRELPDGIRVAMAPDIELGTKQGWEYLKKLPLPRRMRKRMLRSQAWVLNLFAGKDKKQDPIQALSGSSSTQVPGEVVVINVDTLMNAGWDLCGEAYQALVWGAMLSKVKAVIGAPPTRALEAAMEEKFNGTNDLKYGKELEIVAKQFFLYLLSFTVSEGAEPSFVFGAPTNREGVWKIPMVKEFVHAVNDIGVEKTTLEQGGLGHPQKAPTTLLQNVGLGYLEGEKDMRTDLERASEGNSLPGKWCPGLRRAIAAGIRECGIGDGRDRDCQGESLELKRLTKEQSWKLHIARDHVPYRRDCEQCVMMLGTGRPHRRTKQKSAYVLSVDVGGPMRVKSKDAHGSGYKYFLAAAYTKPRFEDTEPPEEPVAEDFASIEYDFADLEVEELPKEHPSDHLSDYEPSLDEEGEEAKASRLTVADSWWDDDEVAQQEQLASAEEQEGVEGNHAVPIDHLYFVKPLKGKSSKHIKMAIQEVVLQLRQENLPVVRIHADRAHEMRSAALHEWALTNGILLTRTEGQSPQGNGTAERAVRYLKGQARKLLRTAGLDTSFWATAMLTAAHHQREGCLRPEDYRPPCPYGTKVAIKHKIYGQGGRLDLLPRWMKGIYLGPVWDVGQGSAVYDEESRRITVTTHIRPNLYDAGTAAEAPTLEVEPPVRRRLRGKSPVDDDGLKVVKAARTAGKSQARRALEEEILKEIDAKGDDWTVKRPQLRAQGDLGEEEGYVTYGAYQFGGIVGVTNATKEDPDFAKKIAALMSIAYPTEVFSSITVVRNTRMPLHRDIYNDRRTSNLAVPLRVTKDAAIWEELRPGDIFTGTYEEMIVNDKVTPGQLHSLQGDVKFNPARWHQSIQTTEGERVLLAGHTIGSWNKLRKEDLRMLDELGFAVPEEDEEEFARLKAIQENNEEVSKYPLVVEGEDVIPNFSERDPEVEVDEEVKLAAKAAAENLYTHGIEDILERLEGDLRVVHTIHPREVEPVLRKWIPALGDEVTALETIGAVKRRRGKDAQEYLRRPGVTVVPGKAVFTVKPPNKEGSGFRRKARIVGCGNFQPKGNSEDNYSGGAAAESVRLGVAEAARRKWWLCNGDIANAFLRAPVPQGTLLALRPPAVLVRAGLAEEGEIWEVCTALYGFRSSPRWWSSYRTMMMQKARTQCGFKFLQGRADGDTWRIVDAEGATRGVVIVYVDDYLIAGDRQACEETHNWFATTWKTTELQYATPDTSIRFLGMEIKQLLDHHGNFDGYSLDQEGYVEELLRHRGVQERDKSLIPAAKDQMSLDPATFPTSYTQTELKEAQSRTGELAWLCQRTRPDVSYVTNVMSSLAVRDPQRVCRIGAKCLAYLNATKHWKLHFRSGGDPTLSTYTDSSYAPEGDRSHGGSVTFWASCPVAWRSGRQALVTTSSAETELVEAHQGCLQMESVNALLDDFAVIPEARTIHVDNAAAIALATAEGGSWKTRHLKVRHRALRE